MLVTVIIPVYKVEQYIEKCIESIRRQTYKNLEIILVNDGSPDNCGAICDRYAQIDSRIKVIHKENGGLGDARNVGAKAANGDYLLFIDSDDYVSKELVEKVVTCGQDTQADMVIFDYASVDQDGNILDTYRTTIRKNQSLTLKDEPKILYSAPSAVNKLYRTSFWKETGLEFIVGRYYEDLGTIPKLYLLAKSIVFLDTEPLYYYLIRSGSIMHGRDFERNFKDRTFVLNGIIDFYKEHGMYECFKDELEFLTLDNGYFLPCKEIVLSNYKSPVLCKFRKYIDFQFPEHAKNPYIKNFTIKNKVLFFLLRRKQYCAMLWMSYARRIVESVVKKK